MRLALAIFIYFVTAYQPAIAVTADEEVTRGQLLYENHCTSCHESTVYIRTKRKATNYKEVGNWVNQFADWLNLGWGDVEKQEVMQYLNERYYKYPLIE